MEAVGLAASIITLVGAGTLTSTTLTRLWGLRGSPLYVTTALNEVNDFKATLTLVQTILDMVELPEDILAELSRLLRQAKTQLEAFDRYLREHVLREVDGAFDIE